jgi:hypothetical protein
MSMKRWATVCLLAGLTGGCGEALGSDLEALTSVEQELVGISTRIQAEAYDRFNETTPASNHGKQCDRADGVDKQLTTDPSGGTCNVGWTAAGEWLEYDLSVQSEALFAINLRLASNAPARKVHAELDGVNLGSLAAPAGGWQVWSDRRYTKVRIKPGKHVLRVVFDTGGVNFNYFDVTQNAPTCADGIDNGNEGGVDCDGSCPACPTTSSRPRPRRRGTSPFDFAGDPNPNCTLDSTTDSDGDRLPDRAETNTGVFVGPNSTGTSPSNPDTDADGIADGDEALGTTAGLDLPRLGLNPLRKNILLEYDWFTDSIVPCEPHSHRPNQVLLDRVSAAFANAPVSNPDGTTGITLIHDFGQGGVLTGGNFISDSDGVVDVFESEYQAYKSANFAANRVGYFHYVLMPHAYHSLGNTSSGVAFIVGSDMIVSLQCSFSDVNVGNTIMHELGHNLGLHHGGFEATNNKPNYNSVMNYNYQFPGVDDNCTPPGDGVLDYSRNERISLNEAALNESVGICNDVAWDWDRNGSIQTNVSIDINGDGPLTMLTDYNDWANLVYAFAPSPAVGASSNRLSQQVAVCDNPAPVP